MADSKKNLPHSAVAEGLHDLDKVRLKHAVRIDGFDLPQGRVGTVVFCYGADAYDVEFEGIEEFFQIRAGLVERLVP